MAGLRSADGASRLVLRHALQGRLQPLFGNALWLEYQELLNRPVWCTQTTPEERSTVLAALARQGRWVRIYYVWRPNLPDEGDNHLIELAIAGDAEAIVTCAWVSYASVIFGSADQPNSWRSWHEHPDDRLPDDTAERLRALARSRGLNVNKLIEELSAQAFAARDTESHFRRRRRWVTRHAP